MNLLGIWHDRSSNEVIEFSNSDQPDQLFLRSGYLNSEDRFRDTEIVTLLNYRDKIVRIPDSKKFGDQYIHKVHEDSFIYDLKIFEREKPAM